MKAALERLLKIFFLCLLWQHGFAQEWPTRPIKLIVPFPAGGPTDLVAREAANIIREDFKQAVVVDNKPGGNGVIGHGVLAKSPPDGYTLGLVLITVAVAPHLGAVPFDTFKDFSPITNLIAMTPIVVANNQAPFNTLSELIAYAKAHPNQLSFGTPGVATMPHLAAELLQLQSGIKMTHIPYKGATQQMQDLMAGVTLLDFQSSLVLALPQLKAEKIKALAVFSEKRTAQLPLIPSAKESGFGDLTIAPWFGIGAPAGVSSDIVQKLHNSLVKGFNSHDVQERFTNIGASVQTNKSPQEFNQYIKSEFDRWGKVIKTADIKSE
jgi:tripartite-type tricarboxylate transporter receptor subunit TctC